MEHQEAIKGTVEFRGHPMIRGSHPTTIEVTTERYLTEEGDCIIGVAASSGCLQLDDELKEALRKKGAQVKVRIVVEGRSFEFNAKGDPRLELSHPHDIVIRKSDFVNGRTLAIGAGMAARSIPRELIHLLKNPQTLGKLEIEVT